MNVYKLEAVEPVEDAESVVSVECADSVEPVAYEEPVVQDEKPVKGEEIISEAKAEVETADEDLDKGKADELTEDDMEQRIKEIVSRIKKF